jgi:hypothetical protein
MTKLKVKLEKPPERCEICHQSDLFEPASGICQRCAAIEIAAPPPQQNHQQLTFIQRTVLAISVFTRIFFIRWQINYANQPLHSLIKSIAILAGVVIGIIIFFHSYAEPYHIHRVDRLSVETKTDIVSLPESQGNVSPAAKPPNIDEPTIVYFPDNHGIFKSKPRAVETKTEH